MSLWHAARQYGVNMNNERSLTVSRTVGCRVAPQCDYDDVTDILHTQWSKNTRTYDEIKATHEANESGEMSTVREASHTDRC